MSDSKIIVDVGSAEVVNAATAHAEAVEKSRVAQMEVTFETSLEKFFNKRTAEGRFIDIARIPFICDDLHGIHESMNAMTSDFKWLRWLSVGMAGGMGSLLIAILLALINKII